MISSYYLDYLSSVVFFAAIVLSGRGAMVQLLVLYTKGNLFAPLLPSLSDQTMNLGPFQIDPTVNESLNICTH